MTNQSQVRLTIKLEGRLGATASNSNNKKERRLASILEKKGKSFHNEYTPPTYHECSQSLSLSPEAVQFFTSDEGKPAKIAPSSWKKLSKVQRLEFNLQLQADAISGHSNTTYSYAIID